MTAMATIASHARVTYRHHRDKRWQHATNDRLVNNIIVTVIVLSCDATQLQQTI